VNGLAGLLLWWLFGACVRGSFCCKGRVSGPAKTELQKVAHLTSACTVLTTILQRNYKKDGVKRDLYTPTPSFELNTIPTAPSAPAHLRRLSRNSPSP
jgi:hypothetical protein